MSIPKTIWQTYKTSFEELPSYAKEAAQTWIDLNPDYEYKYMSDTEVESFILQEYGQRWRDIFVSCPVGVMKGNIFRFLIIYRYGGVYADLDAVCIKPISSWVNDNHKMFIGIESWLEFLEWTFASEPGNPAIKCVIDKIENNFENPDYSRPHFVHRMIGPWVWTDGILETLQTDSFDLYKDYDKINNSDKAKELGIFILGGDDERAFYDKYVKHLFGSQTWTDGNYDQWVKHDLTEEYINTVDLRLMYLEEKKKKYGGNLPNE